MSENLNRDFSQYDAMTTEELEEILRSDAEAPMDTPSDTDLLLYIMEVLAKRRNANNITGNNAQKAWESFVQNYMPAEPQEPVVGKFTPFLRRLTAAAAVVVLLIAIPVSTRALSLGQILDIFARWARETFSFVSGGNENVSEPSPEDEDHFESLQEMLLLSNRDPSIVPTRIPDGFVLDELYKSITPVKETYTALYLNGSDNLQIQVRTYLSSDTQVIEIEDDPIEIYTHNGIDYYIFENMEQLRAVALVGSYEYLISGDISIDVLKLMIDSIQKEVN